MRLLAALGLVFWLGFAHLEAQGRGGARRFSLSGAVVDGRNQPMPGVEVSLSFNQRDAPTATVVSDAQGRFGFSGLAAGEYSLWAEGSFGMVPYGETPGMGPEGRIRFDPGSGDKSVVFRILPRGAIEGVIRDEFGDPMMRAGVSISRPIWRDGRITASGAGSKSTDDRGRYRFGNLAPGTYIVCATGGQGAVAPMPGPVDYATQVDNRYYARTCNRAFELSPGQQAQVDLSPAAGTTATLRGHVRNLPARTGFSVNLLPEDDGQIFGAFVDATQATFTIRGVQPGRYTLRAQSYSNAGPQKALAAEMPLDVGGSDMDGIEVELAAEGKVEVTFHGATEEQIQDLNVSLRGAGPTGATRGYAQAKDGVFQFQNVPAGSYRLLPRTSDQSCVESVKLGDTEMRGAAFNVAAGAALHFDVGLSQNCGAIRMRAVRGGAAVARAEVVLLVSGTPGSPVELREKHTDDDGQCDFSGLTPGRYLSWAWAVEGDGAMVGPASLAAVEQQATAVDVTAGDPLKVDVPLLSAVGSGQ